MGMVLAGREGDRYFDRRSWAYLIELALQYGWEPAGAGVWDGHSQRDQQTSSTDSPTPATEESPCKTDPLQQVEQVMAKEASVVRRNRNRRLETYFANEGNFVSAEDAGALGDALERALPDVPDHDATAHKTYQPVPGVRRIRPGVTFSPLEWFSGSGKERLRDFIGFCRQGEFDIT